MSNNNDTWAQLLNLNAPWHIQQTKTNEQEKRYDIWISSESKKRWFSLSRRLEAEHFSWRHINIGKWQVHLHVTMARNVKAEELPWAGKPDIHFTHEFTSQILDFMKIGLSLKHIGQLLNITLPELWRLRYAIDNGQLNFPKTESIQIPPEVEADDTDIPSINSPVWIALVENRIEIKVQALALKMLLSRLRVQLENISDNEIRELKLQELHNYFVKNKQMLTSELAQLREEASHA
ncbi:MAG: hypothetical protein P8X74_19060 [Reinekea sp.]|jgi:hypothetical protein